jgi:hypothetical protein
MKLIRSALLILIAGTLIVTLSASVLADSGDNDSFETAEGVLQDNFSGSLIRETDESDWYVIEVPPRTDIKITVKLTGPDTDDEIIVSSFIEKNAKDQSINMTLDRSLNEDKDTFSNDGSGFVDLYIHLSGEGSYEVEYLFIRDIAGGLCGSIFVLILIPIGIACFLIVYRR